ncbi:MAG TPA: flagellar basal body L-ring protein FlgH [Candidatus Brocadiia bacterium]|nr:flagellar basal body L-ring protein FlgH [Planctomycetota bacterium]MDO8094507.1 flagellar basal body L-ring protein FlgH [Candidatus Brocadiales bacterium]
MKIKITLTYMVFQLVIISLCSMASGDSLWKKRFIATSNLYNDNRARDVGDIVTVLINESTELKGEETTDLSKQSSLKSETDVSDFLTGVLKNHKSQFDEYLPNIESETNDAFKGDGNYVSTRGVDLKMTALITDILPSGNLVVEGARTVSINKETYNIRLSGIARPVDIMDTFRDVDGVFRNVVRSTSLANASVTLEGKGFLTRAGKRGWFWRVRDIFWPF